ncbi:otogelin [Cricetulus griseus]
MEVALPDLDPTSFQHSAHKDLGSLSPVLVYNAGPERDSICRSWGQYHVETFDGLYYYLSAKGSYMLVGHHEPEGQRFSIQVHNDPQCGSAHYSCPRSVSLLLWGEHEIRLAKEVTHGGVRVQLPQAVGGVQLQQLAGYVIARHPSAFTLAWDGASAVYVKMSPEFLGWTHGLCGNNNADPQDDLVTSYAECSVTGDIHFTTFDGRRYTFPATCQYILAKSRSSGTFTVTLQNAPCGLNQDGACVQSVSVILHQDSRRQVTLTKAGDVLLFDQYKITPPYSDDAFEIRRLSSVFLRVKTNMGVQVLYDWEGLRLYLQVDQRWVEDTVGLCGTFNGNTQDDFLYVSLPGTGRRGRPVGPFGSPMGVPESTPQLFGNSWKTLSACSPLVPGSLLDPCDVHLQAASYALQSCSVLMGELFAPCSAYLSPIPYLEQCRRDACRCGQPCLCATLAHYAHLCRRHGLLVDFRAHLPACALSCEATKEYSPCVALCAQTCQDLASPDVCGANGGGNFSRDECVEGCTCPPDMYLDTQADLCVPSLLRHGNACFPPEECPCVWKGKEYFPGDQVASSCHTCVCRRGSFQCTLHPCASTCTVYGDRHYRTFDGLPFDFVGACKVHLIKSTSELSFSVMVEDVNCYSSGVICRKSISISVGSSLVIFDDDSGYPGQLVGLCGNFDLKTVNEMRTPENLELTNPQEFGSSWAAVECPDTPDPRDTCVLNPLREPFARKECSILLSEVFEPCHPVVDVTWFYSNCLTDTCGCSWGGDCECFCASVSAYAHQCCQHGVVIDWRTPRLCPYDCDFFNKALGKGPYQLSSVAAGGTLVASKAVDSDIALVRAEDLVPGDISSFLLTAALYKAKAHDPDVLSLEAADRPNFFLHTTDNGSIGMAKWRGDEAFHKHASFSLHRGTWQAGLVALESLAKPGSFLHSSGLELALRTYEHTEAFRGGALFRLLGVEPALQGPTERALNNETLAPGQALTTPSDKLQLPQEPPRAPTHRPALVQVAPLTSAPNPPMAATKGPVPSPGPAQSTLQTPLGLTTSNLPDHYTEALAREEGAASLLAISYLPGTSSSLLGSLQASTSGTVSGTTETTKVTVTFAGSPNTTVSSRSPPVARFPLLTKAVTVLSHDSFPVRTTPLQPSWRPSPSSRSVISPGATSRPPTPRGSHLTATVTKATNKTGMSPFILSQSTSSSSHPLAVVSSTQRAVHPLVTKDLEVVPATEKEEPGHSQPIRLPHPAQHTATAPGLVSLESTRPPQLLSGLPLDTILPLAKVGTSAPVATPGPQGSITTPPPQHQATTLTLATAVTPPAHILSPTVPLRSAVEDQAHSPSSTVPQITAVAPDLILGATSPSSGASGVTAGVPPTVSVAPRKSTTPKAAILSKKVSPPTSTSGSAHDGFTELTAIVSHTVTSLEMETEGPQAGTVPLVSTSYSLSQVSARTASREGSLVLLPQLAEAHGTPAELQPQEDVMRQATTEQSGRSAPAQSIAEGSMEVEVNISDTCVPIAEQDCVRHICLEGQLIRVNQSQHCPQGAARPHCGVLGLAVRVGGDRCCPLWECACRCSIFPDLSFVTFDGSHVALFKEAIYILSQSPDEIISVHVLDCKSANLVTVDSQAVWPPVSRYGFRIEDTGHMYIIRTPSHIQIQWLHSSGLMILEASKTSKAQGRGLCGICDADTANDLTLKDGSVVGEAEDPAPFLDSWQVPSSLTSEGQTRFRPDSCATADCSPCLRMVSNRTFSACHRFVGARGAQPGETFWPGEGSSHLQRHHGLLGRVRWSWALGWEAPGWAALPNTFVQVSPESFCELWIRDTKYVQQPCVALTVYVAMCHKFHVCIEWRGSDYCPFLCSSDSTYQACVAACEPPESCQDGILGPLDPEQCQVLGEGCVCSEGTILHRRHSALCIPEDKCECDPGLCEDEQVPTCRQDQVLIAGRLGDSCCTSYFCVVTLLSSQAVASVQIPSLSVKKERHSLCTGIPQSSAALCISVWEKSQLDEGFMHSVENVCGCAKYECVKAPVCLSHELGVMQPGQTVIELSADGVCHTSRCTDVLDPLTSFYQINITSVLCDMHCEANQEYDHPRDLAACCGSCRNVSCLFTFPNGTTSLFLVNGP